MTINQQHLNDAAKLAYYANRFGPTVAGAIAASGNIDGVDIIHKFGRNDSVGTSFVPVTMSGTYPTPLFSNATALRVKAGGNANDTAAGSGAREITLQGLDDSGVYQSVTLATAGASASSYTTVTFSRLFRYFVSASGTYASATAGSHAGTITIEDSSANVWGLIDAGSGFPMAQSEVACYTVPAGKTAFVQETVRFTDSSKPTGIIFFRRDDADDETNYGVMRKVESTDAQLGQFAETHVNPLGPFREFTDIGFMAKVGTGSASVAVNFEIILIDNTKL